MRKVNFQFCSILVSCLFVCGSFLPALAMEAKLSGQINQMAMYADDGVESDFFITDNDASSTRVRIDASETFGKIKAGIRFEIEAQRNASNKVTINQTDDGSFEWNDRWLNVYFGTSVGTFEIGKGNSAANETTEVDLSGTSLITYSDISTTGGSLVWRNSDGTGFRGGIDIGDTRTNFDGALSRTQRLRYNTPKFAGFTLSGAVSNGGAWDASVWYSAELYGKLAGAIGYTNTARKGSYNQLAGSISWLAPFGLSITAACGQRDLESNEVAAGKDDPSGYYFKVGYKTGIHAVSVEYGMTEDLHTNGDESSNYGIGYVVKPWKPVEFYAGYRLYKLEVSTGSDPEDIQVAAAGTRIKF